MLLPPDLFIIRLLICVYYKCISRICKHFFSVFQKNLFLCIFQDAPSVLPQNLIFMPLYHTFLRFCIVILPFYTRFLPLPPPKHRLRNRNFSLLLCKITLKMHKNKFFCISHFTLFEQNCYKSCNNIKLYLRFLQIILYIYSRFCKIMPYYSHTFTSPLPRHYACIRIYARTRMHAQYMHTHIHTQLHVYTHAYNIYKGGGEKKQSEQEVCSE